MAFHPWKDEWDDGMCEFCISQYREVHAYAQNMAWNELPSIFGLPGWNDLSKE